MIDKKINEETILKTVTEAQPINYRFHYADTEDKLLLGQILTIIMHKLNKDFLIGNLKYILHELVDNANRALIKRIYFSQAGLDISDRKNYEQGMKKFTSDYYDKAKEYTSELNKSNLYLEVQFQLKEAFLNILIRNKGLPTEEEMRRIQYRFDLSQKIRNTGEAFDQLNDQTEGAGLGTSMIILLLRKITNNPDHIKPYSFYLDYDNEQTIADLNIALNTLPEKLTEKLSEEISAAISSLPMYPENILKVDTMLKQENLSLSSIASVIERDPTLTTELLKLINSAQYFLPQRVKSIKNAVSLIGINGLRNLMLSFGAQKVLEKNYGKQEELWEHSYRCAFYAATIANKMQKSQLIDDAYTGGILHDIGEIIIRNIDHDLIGRITEFCQQKGITGDIIEQLTIGCSHAKVSGHILRKWNFPEVIVDTVEYANQPFLAPEEWKEVVEIVYLADHYAMYHEERITLTSFDTEILKKFSLETTNDLIEFGNQIQAAYTQKLEKHSV